MDRMTRLSVHSQGVTPDRPIVLPAARVVRSKAQASKGYGFVKFQHVQQAVDAIRTFNGFALNNHPLEVKFADQDAGPPLSGNVCTGTSGKISIAQGYVCSLVLCPFTLQNMVLSNMITVITLAGSGATPSDNLYIRVGLHLQGCCH